MKKKFLNNIVIILSLILSVVFNSSVSYGDEIQIDEKLLKELQEKYPVVENYLNPNWESGSDEFKNFLETDIKNKESLLGLIQEIDDRNHDSSYLQKWTLGLVAATFGGLHLFESSTSEDNKKLNSLKEKADKTGNWEAVNSLDKKIRIKEGVGLTALALIAVPTLVMIYLNLEKLLDDDLEIFTEKQYAKTDLREDEDLFLSKHKYIVLEDFKRVVEASLEFSKNQLKKIKEAEANTQML